MALEFCCWRCYNDVSFEQKSDGIFVAAHVEWRRKKAALHGFCGAFGSSFYILMVPQIDCSEKRVWYLLCGPIENCYSSCHRFLLVARVYLPETVEIVADVAPQI
jgi:hypothetical protein